MIKKITKKTLFSNDFHEKLKTNMYIRSIREYTKR